jgi:hypothetical protein
VRPQGERSSLCAPKLAARRILDGSFAPEPSRGAGRLCPEFSKTEPSPSAIPLTRCTVAAIVLKARSHAQAPPLPRKPPQTHFCRDWCPICDRIATIKCQFGYTRSDP